MISKCDALETITIENAEIDSFSSRAFFSLFSVTTVTLNKLKVGIFQDGPFAGMLNFAKFNYH